MEYQLGATASFLEGPRDLHCGIVIVQEELIVVSPTVGKTFEARIGQSLPNGQAVPTLRLISAQFRGFRVSKLKVPIIWSGLFSRWLGCPQSRPLGWIGTELAKTIATV